MSSSNVRRKKEGKPICNIPVYQSMKQNIEIPYLFKIRIYIYLNAEKAYNIKKLRRESEVLNLTVTIKELDLISRKQKYRNEKK